MKIKPDKIAKGEVELPCSYIGMLKISYQGKKHCNCVFSHRVWRIGRHSDNWNLVTDELQIHIVESCTPQRNQTDMVVQQNLKNLCIKSVIHKRADNVEP